jgi:hypothetical protein
MFFSEEKNQKTSASLSRAFPAAHAREEKSSGSFFIKEHLSLFKLRNKQRCNAVLKELEQTG